LSGKIDLDMTREEAIKEAYGIPVTKAQHEALQFLIPELAENDDERIRKEIVNYFSQFKENGLRGVDITKWIAYLEKQKEHEPEEYSPLCNTINDKIQEYITNHFITDTVVKTDVNSIAKAMEEGVRLGKKEQNPKFNVGDTIRLKNSYAEYTIESISDGKYYCHGCTIDIDGGNRDYELVQHKPAEWSEEDEKFIKDLCNLLAAIAKNNYVGGYYAPDLISKIQSLRPSFKPNEEKEEPEYYQHFDPDF
jgi:hypothetical protein